MLYGDVGMLDNKRVVNKAGGRRASKHVSSSAAYRVISPSVEYLGRRGEAINKVGVCPQRPGLRQGQSRECPRHAPHHTLIHFQVFHYSPYLRILNKGEEYVPREHTNCAFTVLVDRELQPLVWWAAIFWCIDILWTDRQADENENFPAPRVIGIANVQPKYVEFRVYKPMHSMVQNGNIDVMLCLLFPLYQSFTTRPSISNLFIIITINQQSSHRHALHNTVSHSCYLNLQISLSTGDSAWFPGHSILPETPSSLLLRGDLKLTRRPGLDLSARRFIRRFKSSYLITNNNASHHVPNLGEQGTFKSSDAFNHQNVIPKCVGYNIVSSQIEGVNPTQEAFGLVKANVLARCDVVSSSTTTESKSLCSLQEESRVLWHIAYIPYNMSSIQCVPREIWENWTVSGRFLGHMAVSGLTPLPASGRLYVGNRIRAGGARCRLGTRVATNWEFKKITRIFAYAKQVDSWVVDF
ncbi:hypothetical protein J6590_020834 [Homalodisca vitripennis]|nr:hypothetical protein J6590_020834 [Homalodisca vitripennis]